jgi:large subunit ribosomal protein L24
MDKVYARVAAAKRQLTRRNENLKKRNVNYARKKQMAQERMISARRKGLVKDARRRWKEDWELGPLAPKRDYGSMADRYGTMDSFLYQSIPKHPSLRMKHWHIAEGDRIVIIKGRDQGKIGTVSSIDVEKEVIRSEGLNMV